jgi:polysaccharide biosynthesis protein PslG
MRRVALLAALVAASLVLAAPGVAGARTPARFFGVMVNGVLDAPSVNLAAESATMHRDGVASERFEIAWDLVEPRPGAFDFAAIDRKVAAAASNGIDVLGLVVRTPGWAATNPGNPFSAPRAPAAYAAFLRTLIGRYGPRGSFWPANPSLPRRPVRNWQIWNEPNIAINWDVQPWQNGYARLLRAAYPAVKSADPGARVVMAGLANFSWRDLSKAYRAGVKGSFDVAAVHPFSGRPSNSLKITRLNRDVMNRNGDRRKPIWLTELTWSSAKGRKTPLTQNWETTEAGQAQRLRQAYRLYVRARTSLRLGRIFWYTWATIDRDSKNSFDYSGLRTLRPDGRFVSKPALAAFRDVARRYG